MICCGGRRVKKACLGALFRSWCLQPVVQGIEPRASHKEKQVLDYLCEPHPGSVILMTICQLGRVGRIFVGKLGAGLVRGVCRGERDPAHRLEELAAPLPAVVYLRQAPLHPLKHPTKQHSRAQ